MYALDRPGGIKWLTKRTDVGPLAVANDAALKMEYHEDRQDRSIIGPARRFARSSDVKLGRLFFSNTTPLINNLFGRAAIAIARHRSDRPSTRPVNALALQFEQRGYVDVPDGMIRADVVAEIARAMKAGIEDERSSIRTGENLAELDRQFPHRTFARKLTNPQSIRAIGLLISEALRDYLESCLDCSFSIATIECYRTYHVEPEVSQRLDVYSEWWHCDQRASDICKLFVNLCDVDQQGGPFMAATRAQTATLLGSPVLRAREEAWIAPDLVDDLVGPTKCLVGPTGTALLCNTQLCLHRAGVPPYGRHRDLLVLGVVPTRWRLPRDWVSSVDPLFGKRSRYRRPRLKKPAS